MNLTTQTINRLLKTNLDLDLVFDDLQYDSRQVTVNNTLFVVKGAFDIKYLEPIVDKISGIVATEKLDVDIPQFIVSDTQEALALLSAEWFNHPEKELKIIGITGTKGKTSTAYITYELLNHLAPNQVAMFSTIDTYLGPDDHFKSALTTPESYVLYQNMSKAVANGMKYLVMEVSSQAYLKKRVFGLTFDVGMFLNISPDHVGANEHPTFGDYLAKKQMLAQNSKTMLINLDDEHGREFENKAQKDITIGTQNADITYSITKEDLLHSDFLVDDTSYTLNIPGDFNVLNAVFAIAAVEALGFDVPSGTLPIKNIPGRMWMIDTKNHGLIVIDYAHNYESMYKLLSFIKKLENDKKLIVLAGSTGDKGQNRREGFGKVLSEFADVAILTADDPGFENPLDIAHEIQTHITKTDLPVNIEVDRIKAIHQAIDTSKTGDVLVLAGKGDDHYQKVKGVDTPYPGDYQVAIDYLGGDVKI